MSRVLHLATIVLLLTGCAAQFTSPLVEGSLAFPWVDGEERQRVVFPAGAEGQGSGNDSLTRLYGPDWTDLQDEYEEYRFNGER